MNLSFNAASDNSIDFRAILPWLPHYKTYKKEAGRSECTVLTGALRPEALFFGYFFMVCLLCSFFSLTLKITVTFGIIIETELYFYGGF